MITKTLIYLFMILENYFLIGSDLCVEARNAYNHGAKSSSPHSKLQVRLNQDRISDKADNITNEHSKIFTILIQISLLDFSQENGASGTPVELATAFLRGFRALPANMAVGLQRIAAIGDRASMSDAPPPGPS